jgi:hypothetical protein
VAPIPAAALAPALRGRLEAARAEAVAEAGVEQAQDDMEAGGTGAGGGGGVVAAELSSPGRANVYGYTTLRGYMRSQPAVFEEHHPTLLGRDLLQAKL